ncbi:endonuclease/exonuclease/phosphatase family protein [Sphingopyxis sp. P8]|uniref:endonuclease/exonuclease/phosphatase family protein n=1 Tax=Sphingopyxis sp. P8 TaxID=2763256 RepID=UPI001D0B89C2|nr:endonuclease/exonuclease/phosphatase family protein [Sphingopyxis sp. P8]
MATTVKVGTWNVAWRQPTSLAGKTMRDRLLASDPEVLCITEADADFMRGSGHVICADADYGYPLIRNRRKVLLWSRQPWQAVDRVGDEILPPGRFISGCTETSAGLLRFVGVCIPWAAAHVSTGRRDRKRWDEHLAYISGLGCHLDRLEEPFVVMGDFNQAIPKRTAPARVYEALCRSVLEQANVFTTGKIEGCGFAIDHIAGSQGISCKKVGGLSAASPNGTKLSDHFGMWAELSIANSEELKLHWT